MTLSREHIQELKDLIEKKEGKEVAWSEAEEAGHNLVNLVQLLLEVGEKDWRRQKRLEKESKGFHLEGGPYNCRVCYAHISDEETWYDKNGIKCLNCQRALNKKVISQKVCKDRDSWYAMWELNSKFGIKTQTALKKIREGELKPRIIKDESGKPHYYIFLKKDNLELKVVKSNN